MDQGRIIGVVKISLSFFFVFIFVEFWCRKMRALVALCKSLTVHIRTMTDETENCFLYKEEIYVVRIVEQQTLFFIQCLKCGDDRSEVDLARRSEVPLRI